MADEFKVVCGTCKTDAEIVSDSHGKVAVCPTCGQRDSLESAERIAAEHFMLDAISKLQNGIGRVIKGSDAIEFKAKGQPERSFKWRAVSL